MSDPSHTFTRAITRRPGVSVVDGLRAIDQGAPNLTRMLADHAAYVAALREAGATVTELPPLEDFPDALFVEDTALCLPQGVVLMRPGAATRAGEVAQLAPVLREAYETVFEIQGPGFIEGGDILTTSREILVGLSERTDQAGVDALAALVAPWGYSVRVVEIPAGVLHFKTDCSLLDTDTILSTKRLAASGCFKGYTVIHTADGEEACANLIRYNDLILMPAGFPKTTQTLIKAGYDIRQINNSECAKIDGGMSCLSLRF